MILVLSVLLWLVRLELSNTTILLYNSFVWEKVVHMNKSKKVLEFLEKNINEKGWEYYSKKLDQIEHSIKLLSSEFKKDSGIEVSKAAEEATKGLDVLRHEIAKVY